MADWPTTPRPDDTLAEHVADGRSLRGVTLVLATHNAGKLREFRGLCQPFDVEIVSAAELGLSEPDETGETFDDNAILKATTAMEATGKPALADDSGLCVDALDGAPGVYTADWATNDEGSRDFAMAMRKVQDKLLEAGAADDAQRKAQFVATLCLAWPDGTTEIFRGEAPGTLIWPPQGDGGHGYDPMFRPDGHERTFGQMSEAEKHGWTPDGGGGLSHRARAFAAFAGKRLDRR